VALARLAGVTDAARVSGVDERTVRGWVAAEGAGDHSVQEWQAAHDYAMEQHLRASIGGDARSAFNWSQSAGVTQRNLNYQRWVSRRQERQAEEDAAPEPSQAQLIRQSLPRERLTWLRDYLDLRIRADHVEAHNAGKTLDEYAREAQAQAEYEAHRSDPEPQGSLRVWEWLRDATDEDLAAADQELAQQCAELVKGYRVSKTTGSYGDEYTVLDRDGQVYEAQMSYLSSEFRSLPVLTEAPAPQLETHTSSELPAEPPRYEEQAVEPPSVTVTYAGRDPDWDRAWRRWE
jgi:hypothetical protein